MERTINGRDLSETYWSVAEFANQAAEHASRARTKADGDNYDWTGVTSFAEGITLAKDGWADELPETLALAESAVATANQEHMLDTFNPVWDVTGAEVDVARYLSGEPECMIDFPLSKTSHSGRVVTFVAGLCVSGSISPETMINRGRVMTALALALNTLGHAVEIWIDINGHGIDGNRNLTHYQRVLVKSASDELDPAALMFALAHPAMFRVIALGAWDGYPGKWEKEFGDNLSRGRVGFRSRKQRELYPEGTIFLDGLESDDDVPDADQFLREHLGNLGLLAE